MKYNQCKEYSIGLDIGTASVGYSVINNNGELLKIKGKNMWGVRLFEEGKTAKDTRVKRNTRRRYDRRKQRIKLLQEIFASSSQIDTNLFYLLNLTKHKGEFDVNDIYEELGIGSFKTIYHLRKYLISNNEKVDIRLIYLAFHHIVKYRGNFLYEDNTSLSAKNAVVEPVIKSLFEKLSLAYEVDFTDDIVNEVIRIIMSDNRNKEKEEKIKEVIASFDKSIKDALANVVKAILGYKVDYKKVFGLDETYKIKLGEESDKEKIEKLLSELDDVQENVFVAIQNANSSIILMNILSADKNVESLSDAMIYKYDKYHNDLTLLKEVYREKIHNKYYGMFSNKAKGKVYTTFDNVQNCSLKDLESTIVKDFCDLINQEEGLSIKKEDLKKNIENKIQDGPNKYRDIYYILSELENETFLKKVNSTDNGAIPYQLHLEELNMIIDKQGKYYPFLYKNKEKLNAIVSFKVPYWAGPLNAKKNPVGSRQFGWLTKRKEGKIYPWNFDDVVDVDKTAEDFINTLTNYCTYLPNEKVLPKNSLLYSEYMLRNEIFGIKLNDKSLSEQTRIALYEQFKTKKISNEKELRKWFENNRKFINVDKLTGFQDDKKFASDIKSYRDFTEIFGKIDEENYDDIERIIYYLTVYNDKKIIKRRISKEFDYLSNEQINKILNLNYNGWGRLSKRLLNEIKADYDGSYKSIIEVMRTGKYNFMQIIYWEEFNKIIDDESHYDIESDVNLLIDDMYISPANKRAVKQSIAVVSEIESIMKCPPSHIYMEFARGEDGSGRAKTRRKKVENLFKKIDNKDSAFKDFEKCKLELKELNKDNKLQDEMLYLYFLQNGKCLYSGEPLNINNLAKDCQVDHILPRCYIVDDSIDNKALVLKKQNQRKENDLLLEQKIIEKMKNYWRILNKCGFITNKKYQNLIRTEISKFDEYKFINRQLVETRQAIKMVAKLLQDIYVANKTSIVQINAELIHNVRLKYDLYKIRELNDYHHAYDAFLACEIGIFAQKIIPSVYKKFDRNTTPYYFANISKDQKRKNKYGYVVDMIGCCISDKNGELEWNGLQEVIKLKEYYMYKDCFISKKLEEGTGEFYKQTLISPNKSPNISIKKYLDPMIYGGYTGEKNAYCVIVEYETPKGKKRELIGIPIRISYLSKSNPNAIYSYLESLGKLNPKIIKDKILKHQKIRIKEPNSGESFEAYIASSSEIHNATQLLLPYKDIQALNGKVDESKLDEEYLRVFEDILEKMKKYFAAENSRIFSNVYKKLNDAEVKQYFKSLELNVKRTFLLEILRMLHANAENGNLKSIISKEKTENKNEQDVLSNFNIREGRANGYPFNLDNIVFINTSVTGIFQNEVCYGIQNNSSNK